MATGLVFEAVLVNGAIVRHLAARAVINVSRKTFADGFVVLSQANCILAAGLVFADVSALFDSLGAELALVTLPTVFVFQAFVLRFSCAATNKIVGIAVVGILANTVCSVANGVAYSIRATLRVDANILALAGVVLADHAG